MHHSSQQTNNKPLKSLASLGPAPGPDPAAVTLRRFCADFICCDVLVIFDFPKQKQINLLLLGSSGYRSALKSPSACTIHLAHSLLNHCESIFHRK
jgi:hypothetical protein